MSEKCQECQECQKVSIAPGQLGQVSASRRTTATGGAKRAEKSGRERKSTRRKERKKSEKRAEESGRVHREDRPSHTCRRPTGAEPLITTRSGIFSPLEGCPRGPPSPPRKLGVEDEICVRCPSRAGTPYKAYPNTRASEGGGVCVTVQYHPRKLGCYRTHQICHARRAPHPLQSIPSYPSLRG